MNFPYDKQHDRRTQFRVTAIDPNFGVSVDSVRFAPVVKKRYYQLKITSRLTPAQREVVRQSTDSRPALAARFGVTVDQIRYAQR